MMTPAARAAFNAYVEQQARINNAGGPEAAAQGFTIAPSVQQKLETKVQESSDFLRQVNISPVSEQEGEKLGLGISGPIASRTDTSAANSTGRQTVDPTTLDSGKYRCEKTNSDTEVRYSKLDTWAKFPDFQARMRNVVVQRQALDRIMIGFNGTSVAATTNRVNNPMLQDVNKGWLQHLREDSPAHVMATGDVHAGKVCVGAGGDYGNLDALVFDALELMPTWARTDTALVCIVGHALMHDKFFPLVNVNQAPTEQLAAGQIMSQKKLGAKTAIEVPYFPDHSILITRLDNLSIYYQDGSRRSRVIDNPKFDRIETYESSNDAYVLEDNDFAVVIENITTNVADWD